MKYFGIVLLVMLVFAVASAQTQWEYATFQVSSTDADFTYSFDDSERSGYSDSLQDLGLQIGYNFSMMVSYNDFIQTLGKEGYELVNYDNSMVMFRNQLLTYETWYFKRPLP